MACVRSLGEDAAWLPRVESDQSPLSAGATCAGCALASQVQHGADLGSGRGDLIHGLTYPPLSSKHDQDGVELTNLPTWIHVGCSQPKTWRGLRVVNTFAGARPPSVALDLILDGRFLQ